MITDHADVVREDIISGIASPLTGRFQNKNQTTASNSPAKMERAPTVFPDDSPNKPTPITVKDNTANTKKDTEKYECVRPAVSGKKPIAKRLIAVRIKRRAPTRAVLL